MSSERPESLIVSSRRAYHADLCRRAVVGLRAGVPSMADRASATSRGISERLMEGVHRSAGAEPAHTALSGQSLGQQFSVATRDFIQAAFGTLAKVRPGDWIYTTEQHIAHYDQYVHLDALATLADQSPELRTLLGEDYIVKPDIVVARRPMPDAAFSHEDRPVIASDDLAARATPLRSANAQNGADGVPILHASISCKWTMRSDRAQNTRTEALNLIRTRKGRVPVIAAVTAEPMPSRLASLALGTGDIDRVYHFALYELREAVDALAAATDHDDQKEMLDDLISGRRLSDISDLPFDLAI